MSTARELVERWWELFYAGQLERMPEIVAADAEMVMPGGLRIHGPAQMRPLLEAYQQAFPDIRSEIMTTVETPDAIALELRISGTHTGPMQTPGGSIPPTGKSVVWESVDIVRVSDGKITSWHAYFDQVAFLTQLGLMPATT